MKMASVRLFLRQNEELLIHFQPGRFGTIVARRAGQIVSVIAIILLEKVNNIGGK